MKISRQQKRTKAPLNLYILLVSY